MHTDSVGFPPTLRALLNLLSSPTGAKMAADDSRRGVAQRSSCKIEKLGEN